MDQVLPKNYVFNPQYIYNPIGINSKLWDRIRVWQVWLILGAIFLLGFLLIKNSKSSNSSSIAKSKTSGEGIIIFGVVTLILCISFSTNIINPKKFNQSLYRPYDENSIFILRFDSNIWVKQDRTDYPGVISNPKAYPYRFYVYKNSDLMHDPIYLGHTKNNKIYFNKSNKAGKTFAKYYNYIKKHHLAKKFKYDFVYSFSGNKASSSTLGGDNIILGAKVTKNKKIKIYNKGKVQNRLMQQKIKQNERMEERLRQKQRQRSHY